MMKKIEVSSLLAALIALIGSLLLLDYKHRVKERELEEEVILLKEELKQAKSAEGIDKDALDEWTTLQMAIVMTESQFNPEAVGTSKDWGIFQITPVYVKEVNRILKEDVYSHEDAFDIGKSIEMFSTMQSHYNPQQDLDTALRYHNKAGWYKKKVKDNINLIKRMEEVRRQLKSLRDI